MGDEKLKKDAGQLKKNGVGKGVDEEGTRGTATGLRGSGDEWMRGPFAQECIDGVTLYFHYVGTRFHLVSTQFHFVRIDFHVASTQILIGRIESED